jgi:hypothetical protein
MQADLLCSTECQHSNNMASLPEAINSIMCGPVYEIIYHEPLRHEMLRGGVIAACAVAHLARLGPTVVVTWDDLVENTVPIQP